MFGLGVFEFVEVSGIFVLVIKHSLLAFEHTPAPDLDNFLLRASACRQTVPQCTCMIDRTSVAIERTSRLLYFIRPRPTLERSALL